MIHTNKKHIFISLGFILLGILILFITGTRNTTTEKDDTLLSQNNELLGFEHTPLASIVPTGTSWEWQFTNFQDGTKIEAPVGKFIFTFLPDMQVSSLTDCNTISSSYRGDGELIKFSPFLSTKMFCEKSLESKYIDHLGMVTSLYVAENELRFNLNQDEGVMIFKKR